LSAAQCEDEAPRVAEAAARCGLNHVVVTSVTRDDLPDGGAAAFAATISALKERSPQTTVEVLIPDFQGSSAALTTVLAAGPDVLNHNLETVPRLYRQIRPQADYSRSLAILARAKDAAPGVQTKTGIMLGLGETGAEVQQVMRDARAAQVDVFTAGQYLQPTKAQLPVVEYLPPSTFAHYQALAAGMGFFRVFVGPLVRSSYHARHYD
jgi:lipoic acid synthetase